MLQLISPYRCGLLACVGLCARANVLGNRREPTTVLPIFRASGRLGVRQCPVRILIARWLTF